MDAAHDRNPRNRTGSRLVPYGTTIFSTITARANAAGAINLGQGFPDSDPPRELIEVVSDMHLAGRNQYSPMPGLPSLRAAVAEDREARGHVPWNPDSEVTITSGATEALAAAFLGLLEIGDEVILFDPAYDAYPAGISMAGGTPVRLSMEDDDFAITRSTLEAGISSRTRMLVLNSPWNPVGRVLSASEIAIVADVCRRHDLICISDEVYERLIFDGSHRSIADLPDMRHRTVVISSLGKRYSCTGWKIGWACASEAITAAIRAAHQFLVFSVPEPHQHAAHHALSRLDQSWEHELHETYRKRRSLLFEGLRGSGLNPRHTEGSYFILAGIGDHQDSDDVSFCDRMLQDSGVAAIPASIFTERGQGCTRYVRFAFCKAERDLNEAVARISRMSTNV
tara:strand:- start:152 stop:1342 length:1191 start_codon:yes stop_codon:yes gene_type:complete